MASATLTSKGQVTVPKEIGLDTDVLLLRFFLRDDPALAAKRPVDAPQMRR